MKINLFKTLALVGVLWLGTSVASAAGARAPAQFREMAVAPSPVKEGKTVTLSTRLWVRPNRAQWIPAVGHPVVFKVAGKERGTAVTGRDGWARLRWVVPKGTTGRLPSCWVGWSVRHDACGTTASAHKIGPNFLVIR